MSAKSNNRRRMTKAERRRIARRKRRIRAFALYGAATVLLIACIAVMAALHRPVNQDSWVVGNSAPEIAAPARNASGMTTAGRTVSDVSVSVPDEAASDEQDVFAVMPIQASTTEPISVHEEDPDSASSNNPTKTDPAEVPNDNSSDTVSITITAAGDCTFGGCLKHDTYKVFKKYVDNEGYDYFFDNFRSMFLADDLTVINLEGPLTDVGTMTDKSSICFRGDPEWTAIMTGSGIELCNFANNHSMDMGQEGFDRTLQALDEADIGYCAYDKVYHTTVKGVRITALGFDKWNSDKRQAAEAVRQERENCDILIVNFHWGWEMHYEPMGEQQRMGRAMIDAGADLVIGTHPHVYGGVELYNGKYICYSLGNFCFGGNTDPSDQRCMVFQQTFNVSGDGTVEDGGINVIPCLVSGDPKKNDFQPCIMDVNDGTTLLKNIARYSNLNRKTLWMDDSYPEQIGLLATLEAKASTPEPTPSPTPKPEIEDISNEPVEDGFAIGTPDGDGQIRSTEQPRLGDSLSEEELYALQQRMMREQMSY